jgi:hypothetical protein
VFVLPREGVPGAQEIVDGCCGRLVPSPDQMHRRQRIEI